MKTIKRLVKWIKSLFQEDDVDVCTTKIIKKQLQKLEGESE